MNSMSSVVSYGSAKSIASEAETSGTDKKVVNSHATSKSSSPRKIIGAVVAIVVVLGVVAVAVGGIAGNRGSGKSRTNGSDGSDGSESGT